jgi:inorganic pyrophosphatase
VIETPAGSRTKYAWDPAAKRFRARKVLPLGMAFPFDFGFVPKTRAEDGDPLDVLVLADAPLAVGAIVACRLLGVLAIEQSEIDDKEAIRNDRLIAVPTGSIRGARWRSLDDPGDVLLFEIEDFFRAAVEREGRSFRLLGRGDAAGAARAIRQARR